VGLELILLLMKGAVFGAGSAIAQRAVRRRRTERRRRKRATS
jgi:hypothetical protein